MSTEPEPNDSLSGNPQAANEHDLSRLLRLKRYELPPPGYFDNFLQEFQRRQRLESMRPNWWERFREGMLDLMDSVRVPAYAYATAGLFAMAAGAWILSSEEIGGGAGMATVSMSQAAAPQELRMDLSSQPPTALPPPVNIPESRFVGTLPPRYLLQSRPSSENEPFSF
jgi:hypothetical protein